MAGQITHHRAFSSFFFSFVGQCTRTLSMKVFPDSWKVGFVQLQWYICDHTQGQGHQLEIFLSLTLTIGGKRDSAESREETWPSRPWYIQWQTVLYTTIVSLTENMVSTLATRVTWKPMRFVYDIGIHHINHNATATCYKNLPGLIVCFSTGRCDDGTSVLYTLCNFRILSANLTALDGFKL